MRHLIHGAAVLVGIVAILVSARVYYGGAITCTDFASHAAAQRYHAANPDSGLDRDSDGNPCERLR